MPFFSYRAFDSDYQRITGSMAANSKDALTKQLEQKNLTAIEVFETKTDPKKSLVSQKELSIFCKQMSVIFFSNISLLEGMEMLSGQTENRQLKTVLSEIHDLMEQNVPFADCIAMYPHVFNSYTINTIRIGETSGTLDQTFDNLSSYFDKEWKMRKKVRTAVSYPIMLTVLMGAIVLLLILKILPMFNDILLSMGGTIQPFTKAILSFSLFVTHNGFVILAVIIAILLLIYSYFHTSSGKYAFDKLKMTVPFSRYIYTRIITTRFARSLALLLRSGVQLLNAFDYITVLIDNKFMEEKFQKFVKKVKSGGELINCMEELNVFPPLLIKMVAIGEKTGHLDEMLSKSAGIFDDEVDEALERLTLMIEPILIIILSIIVGIILLSVMLPMIGIMATIG